MSQSQQLSDDLHSVRQAVARRERRQNLPAPIAWMVALYVVVGYTLLDVNAQWAGWFFMVGGVVLGVGCWFVGKAQTLREGEYDRAETTRIWLHWFSIVLAIAGVIALADSITNACAQLSDAIADAYFQHASRSRTGSGPVQEP